MHRSRRRSTGTSRVSPAKAGFASRVAADRTAVSECRQRRAARALDSPRLRSGPSFPQQTLPRLPRGQALISRVLAGKPLSNHAPRECPTTTTARTADDPADRPTHRPMPRSSNQRGHAGSNRAATVVDNHGSTCSGWCVAPSLEALEVAPKPWMKTMEGPGLPLHNECEAINRHGRICLLNIFQRHRASALRRVGLQGQSLEWNSAPASAARASAPLGHLPLDRGPAAPPAVERP